MSYALVFLSVKWLIHDIYFIGRTKRNKTGTDQRAKMAYGKFHVRLAKRDLVIT